VQLVVSLVDQDKVAELPEETDCRFEVNDAICGAGVVGGGVGDGDGEGEGDGVEVMLVVGEVVVVFGELLDEPVVELTTATVGVTTVKIWNG
jgi:hypothetical protein